MKKVIGSILLIALCMCLGNSAQAEQKPLAIKFITSKTYYTSMQKDEKVRVIMFSGTYCVPCQKAKKELIVSLANKYVDNEKVEFCILYTDKDESYNGKTLYNTIGGDGRIPLFIVMYHNDVRFQSYSYSSDMYSNLEKKISDAIDKDL